MSVGAYMFRKFLATAVILCGFVSVVGVQSATAQAYLGEQAGVLNAGQINDDWEGGVIRLYNSWQECLAGMEAYGPTTTTCVPVDDFGVTALVGKPSPTA